MASLSELKNYPIASSAAELSPAKSPERFTTMDNRHGSVKNLNRGSAADYNS